MRREKIKETFTLTQKKMHFISVSMYLVLNVLIEDTAQRKYLHSSDIFTP